MTTTPTNAARGFTLMETVIAIGVVAVLLTTFLAVFGPATQNIRRAISSQDAQRLQSALEQELHLLREGTDDQYESAFHKAFDWILKSGEAQSAVLLYNYRGDQTDIRRDGTLEPVPLKAGGVSGKDFFLQPAVRRKGASRAELEKDLSAIEGPAFYVRMTQLVKENGQFVEGTHGEIVDPYDSSGKTYTNATDYPQAVIAFTAEFYALPSNSLNYIERLNLADENNDGQPDALGRPLFSHNLAVRR